MKIIGFAGVFLTLLLFSACAPDADSIEIETKPHAVSNKISEPPVDVAIKVGVLAIRSASAANEQYGGIIAHLEAELGQTVELVPVTQESQFTLIESGDLDFTLNNPLAAVQIQRLYGTEFLTTLQRKNTGSFFSGLIIVNNESDIETIEDLKNKKGTCVNQQTAAAGCIFQIHHLQQQGIDPYTDFAQFTETPSQDNIVFGVLNQTFDVGFIRTGQLERMVADGSILTTENFRILDQVQDDFYFPHSTALYPEWPFAAHPNTDPALSQAVQEILLNMQADDPAFDGKNISGFVSVEDYSGIDQLIVSLKLKSWDSQVGDEAK